MKFTNKLILDLTNHVNFLEKIRNLKDLDFFLSEPCRLNTLYWIVNSYKIMGIDPGMKDIVDFVKSCKNEDGGYGGSTNHPSTILTTFNALQILYIYKENFYDNKTINFILSNMNEDGSFRNDRYGMTDNRINCSAVLSLHLLYLNKTLNFERSSLAEQIPYKYCDSIEFDYKKCIEYIISCYNPDGGFGLAKGDESHCAFTFCCISSLRSLGSLQYTNIRDISRFIALRQEKSGGLSGRINKKEDVCYSFWAYATMKMIHKNHLLNEQMLIDFILSCQGKNGGFSDRPKNEADPYHLMFSLAALSLLGYEGVGEVDPGFAV